MGLLIEGVNSLDAQKARIAQFPIPADLTGKRALDIGAWDGWFTFEMERRGAEVVAIDRWDNPRFREMHAALGSRAEYRQMNVYDLDPAKLGRFDVVLFLGVLYHSKHPLLALERVCSVTDDLAAVESFALTDRFLPGMQVEQHSLLRYFERDEFGGQFDNWFAPTPRCLVEMCRTAGFARAELASVHDYGAVVACYRRWPEGPTRTASRRRNCSPPFTRRISASISARTTTITCRWRRPAASLGRLNNMQAQAGGLGAAPISTLRTPQGHWRANFKLPPGLLSGWHEVRVRTADSEWSAPVRIAVDVPEIADASRNRRVLRRIRLAARPFFPHPSLLQLLVARSCRKMPIAGTSRSSSMAAVNKSISPALKMHRRPSGRSMSWLRKIRVPASSVLSRNLRGVRSAPAEIEATPP